jgi:hypothetical protein
MKTVKESTLEKRLTRAVKDSNGLCIKLPAFLYRGIPDRLILLPGARIYFVELKAVRGRVSPHQARFIKFLRTLGFPSDIIQGEDHLKEFINVNIKNSV